MGPIRPQFRNNPAIFFVRKCTRGSYCPISSTARYSPFRMDEIWCLIDHLGHKSIVITVKIKPAVIPTAGAKLKYKKEIVIFQCG